MPDPDAQIDAKIFGITLVRVAMACYGHVVF